MFTKFGQLDDGNRADLRNVYFKSIIDAAIARQQFIDFICASSVWLTNMTEMSSTDSFEVIFRWLCFVIVKKP
jgi:hypothetical protein